MHKYWVEKVDGIVQGVRDEELEDKIVRFVVDELDLGQVGEQERQVLLSKEVVQS